MKFISTGASIGALAIVALFAVTGPASANNCGFEQGTYTVKDYEGYTVGSMRIVHLSSGLHLEGRIADSKVKYQITSCKENLQAQLRKLVGEPDAPGRIWLGDAAGVLYIESIGGDEQVVLTLEP